MSVISTINCRKCANRVEYRVTLDDSESLYVTVEPCMTCLLEAHNNMTPEQYQEKVGRLPEEDELDRVNCLKAGQLGHKNCGWCKFCDKPIFGCECNHTKN